MGSVALLSAACGAGRYDGMLLEAGHSAVGIDQSAGMLARARERFPEVRYEKLGLQETDFREAFDGVICIDAMEHVCPEDWVFGEVADEVEEAYERALGLPAVLADEADEAAYHYCPSLEQVRAWSRSRVIGTGSIPLVKQFSKSDCGKHSTLEHSAHTRVAQALQSPTSPTTIGT